MAPPIALLDPRRLPVVALTARARTKDALQHDSLRPSSHNLIPQHSPQLYANLVKGQSNLTDSINLTKHTCSKIHLPT